MNKIIVFSLLVFLFCSCSSRETNQYRTQKTDSFSTKETAETVTIEYTDSGILKARVLAPEMIGMKKVRRPYVEMPKGIKVDFFASDGSVESYLTSEYAISYTDEKRIIVKRKVEVLNIKGDTMLTEELEWDQKEQKIKTDKFVVIKTKTQTISGYGMEADQTFSDWEIRNVTGTIYKSGEK